MEVEAGEGCGRRHCQPHAPTLPRQQRCSGDRCCSGSRSFAQLVAILRQRDRVLGWAGGPSADRDKMWGCPQEQAGTSHPAAAPEPLAGHTCALAPVSPPTGKGSGLQTGQTPTARVSSMGVCEDKCEE